MNCEYLAMRDGRWVFLDFKGKGNKTRSVAVPLWVKQEIDGLLDVAGIEKGPIFRRVLAPHDLRRTLCRQDRFMPQQKLNLFQFPALRAAELRRRAWTRRPPAQEPYEYRDIPESARRCLEPIS